MQDNVGTIVIGTKVNNKGLEKGLHETEQIINKSKNKDVKITFDGTGYAEVADEVWHRYEAGNEALYKQWYNAQHTKEQLEEIKKMTDEINAKSTDQLKEESIKRDEYYKQLEALEEQKILQQDLARYNETQQRLLKQYPVPELEFDIGVNEEDFDATLKELQFKAEQVGRELEKATNRRNEIIGNVAEIEKEIAVYEREKGFLLEDALKLQRLNELKTQGVQISEEEEKTYQGLQRRSGVLNEVSENYEKLIDAQIRAEQKLEDNGYRVDSLVFKYNNLVEKAKEYVNATDNGKVGIGKMGLNVNKLANKFGVLLKKVGRIALALVGVRTILNLITRSFSTLSQYNEELGTKMEQMRLVLAVALEPVINWIVSMLHTILSLINQISIALSGINLFGRASELWSNKMAKNMASGAGSAKELKKQLAGFDEMNVLNDTSSSGGGGGGGSNIQPWTLQPEFDWSKFDIHIIMDKLKKLVDDVIKGINDSIKNADPKKLADGISTFIVGLIEIINKTFTDLNWGELISTIIQTILHLDWASIIGGLLENIIVTSFIFPIELLLGIIDGYLTALLDFIENPSQYEGSGNKILSSIMDGIDKMLPKLWDLFKDIVVKILKIFGIDASGASESITFENLGENVMKGLEKGIKSLKDNITKIFTDLLNSIRQKFENANKFIQELIAGIINWFSEKINVIKAFLRGFADGIKLGIQTIVDWIKDKFNTVTSFFRDVGIAIGDFFSGAIKGAVNGALSWVESKVNWFIDKINSVISLINKIPGVSIGRLSRISLPRLATGGIINQPGRGVPVGGAIAGESGREGILPLTDRQAMAELGKEIGKWISIQATVPVNIGNRQVARVIQELNNDREFAMNS